MFLTSLNPIACSLTWRNVSRACRGWRSPTIWWSLTCDRPRERSSCSRRLSTLTPQGVRSVAVDRIFYGRDDNSNINHDPFHWQVWHTWNRRKLVNESDADIFCQTMCQPGVGADYLEITVFFLLLGSRSTCFYDSEPYFYGNYELPTQRGQEGPAVAPHPKDKKKPWSIINLSFVFGAVRIFASVKDRVWPV